MSLLQGLLLGVMFYPLIFTVIAKYGNDFNNHVPREVLAKLHGYRARANYAQMNAFESMPQFAIAFGVAIWMQTAMDTLVLWTSVYLVARLLHGFCYVLDWASLRSLMWLIGVISMVMLLLG